MQDTSEIHTEFILFNSMNRSPPCVHSLETSERPEECGTFGCEISADAVAAILSAVVVIALLVSGWLLRQHIKKKRLNLL